MVWSHPVDGCQYVCINGTDLGSQRNKEGGGARITWMKTMSEELKKAGITWVNAE